MSAKDDLQNAFAGESQANRKYLAFAKKADEEGHAQAAKLFRAAAEAETVHAHNHLRAMEGINSTKENIREAINGETYEFTEMYPGFIEQAEAEGEAKAKSSFDLANRVEQIHHGLFGAALDGLEKGGDVVDTPIYVCQYCGNTVEGAAPEKCPICGAPRSSFKLIE